MYVLLFFNVAGVVVLNWFSFNRSVATVATRNLRITTKFTTTTSVDRESTGTRTSVSAGNRKLKEARKGFLVAIVFVKR